MGCPVGPLRNLAVGTFGGPWHIQKARPMLSAGTPPLAGQPAPRPRAPGPGGPFVTAATSAARGPPASRRTQSTPPPAPGTASGRNEKGNLINSFRIQHFPHSIIFKLNNLSLREKGKRRSAQPCRPHKAGIVGLTGSESPRSPPLNAPFHTHARRRPLRLPRSAETLAHGHTASVGLLSAPGGLGGDAGKPGRSGKAARKD